MPPILINGIAYNWSTLAILIGSNILYGITELNFEIEQEKVNNYGIGADPVSRANGNNKYTGSVSLYMEDMKRLIAVSPNGLLTGIPMFTIKAVYGNVSTGGTIDVLSNCEFTKDGQDLKQGDTKFIKNIPIIFAGLNRS